MSRAEKVGRWKISDNNINSETTIFVSKKKTWGHLPVEQEWSFLGDELIEVVEHKLQNNNINPDVDFPLAGTALDLQVKKPNTVIRQDVI